MSIKDYFGNIKTLLVDIPNAELKAQVLAALVDAQTEALELQERVTRLHTENEELRKRLEAKDEAKRMEREVLYLANGAWWRRDEQAVQAYCPSCWAASQMLIPLTRQFKVNTYSGLCPTCKAPFDQLYREGKPQPPST